MDRESEITSMLAAMYREMPGVTLVTGESDEAFLKRCEKEGKISQSDELAQVCRECLDVRDSIIKEAQKSSLERVAEKEVSSYVLQLAEAKGELNVLTRVGWEFLEERDKAQKAAQALHEELKRSHEKERSLNCSLEALQLKLDNQTKSKESLCLRVKTLEKGKEEHLKLEESLRLQVALLEQQKEQMEEQLKERDSLKLQLQEQMKAVNSLRHQVALLELQKAEMEGRGKEKGFMKLLLQEQMKAVDSPPLQVAMVEEEKDDEARKLDKKDYVFHKFI